jgi:hypothetical protein
MRPPTKLRLGMRGQKTELSRRSPLRKRRSTLDGSAIEEEEKEDEAEEEEEEEEDDETANLIIFPSFFLTCFSNSTFCAVN